MCGVYFSHVSAMRGWANHLTEWPASVQYEVDTFPTSIVAAFRGNDGEAMRWGLIPQWSKEFDSKYPTHNARIETVSEKPTFKRAWNNQQRCLIPMAGYYEWTGSKGSKGSKTKWYISDKDTDGLVVAGLWDDWGDNQLSCTMITRPANETLSKVHHRMLVYLTPDSADAWLDGEMSLLDAKELDTPNIIYYPNSERFK